MHFAEQIKNPWGAVKKERDSSRSHKTIRSRLAGAVLIPSVALLAMWLVVSSYLLFDGFYVREVAAGVREVSIPAVSALASAQKERQLSMAYLGRPASGLTDLHAQQQQTDQALAVMKGAIGPLIERAPDAVVERILKLNGLLDELPRIRFRVESGNVEKSLVYSYYNNLLDAATRLFDTQARIVPDVAATQGGIAATALFRATDLMSREGSLVSGAFASTSFGPQEHLEFTNLVGSYHSELDKTIPFSRSDVQEQYQQLLESSSWKKLVETENALIGHGAWTNRSTAGPNRGNQPALPVMEEEWRQVTNQVSTELIKITVAQADGVSAKALEDGTDKLIGVLIGSLIALLASIVAIVVATRVSRTLVDRALVTRLKRLKEEALKLAHERLPNIVRRLQRGEAVDVAAAVPELDYGHDEIGQVADAFNAAQYTAVEAAVKEAQAREGVHNVFLGIAHRNQGLVYRQLKLLDKMEREEEDPEQLECLFQLDHLATRARRNAENLIILGGEQPGRRWRKPVRLVDVLRAAVSETEQYVRVRLQRIPEVAIAGSAVADTIHLVAELVDNATSFSPPRSQVQVHGTVASKGVVVEIEDHGLGMSEEDRERANAMLANPPEFDAKALRGDSRLGLFVVARLAARLEGRVELRDSPYGGTRAIVLIPTEVIVPDGQFDIATGSTTQLPRREVHAQASADQSLSLARQQDPANRWEEETVSPTGNSELDGFWASSLESSSDLAGDISRIWPTRTAAGDVERAEEVTVNGRPSTVDDRDEMKPVLPRRPRPRASESSAVPESTTDRPALPRRRPQQNLAPQLRNKEFLPQEPDDDIGSDRPAEEVRQTMAAFQRGSREGRQAGEHFDLQ